MKKVLIARTGAYGDIIHMSHLPRLLKENGFDFVGVATGFKGKQLLDGNPFIDIIHFFEPGGRNIGFDYFTRRIDILSEHYDKTINLLHTIEIGALAGEQQIEYYLDVEARKKLPFSNMNYYDIATTNAGFPNLCGKYRGEVYYSDEEIKQVEYDLLRDGKFRDNFRVMINISGTGPHKFFIQAKEIAQKILEKYEKAIIILTGGKDLKEFDFSDGKRIRSIAGDKPFRQALLMAKYMDCVIGCESGIMCGASMWDVPTIQLLTATDKKSHCELSKNDYSLQSPAYCSPCFKGPYKYIGCPRVKVKGGYVPLCIFFDENEIISKVDSIYAEHFLKRTS